MNHSPRRPTSSPLDRFRLAIEDCLKVIKVLSRDAPRNTEEDDESFQIEPLPTTGRSSLRSTDSMEITPSRRRFPEVAIRAGVVVFQHHFGSEYRIRSDGKDGDVCWVAARECCQRVLGYGAGFSLKQPPRMTLHGLAFTSNWMKARGGGSARDLSNGWEMRRDPKARFKYTVYPARTDEDHADPLLAGNTLRTARWNATIAFFQTEFKDAPFLTEFVNAMRMTPGEWAPFLAWSDKLQDHGHDALAQKVRVHLPR